MSNKRKAKILLLEDDSDIHEIICDYFTPRGFEFSVFETSKAALSAILGEESQNSKFDVILSDFMLPDSNGVEFIDEVKKINPDIPIVLMTAHGSVDLAVEAIEKGAFDFVLKPLQFSQLAISIERALRLSQLLGENKRLKDIEEGKNSNGIFITKNPAMKNMLEIAKRVAQSDSTTLIQGESGSGKEVLARYIHRNSPRWNRSFVAINCSAIPENLLESELFGHTKGSFTGAEVDRIGLFEEANGGTLFLDEIGDLSLPLQAKLLRVLQERSIKRIGENLPRPINVRIMAATHKDLQSEVKAGHFREDLFFRLNVIPFRIPPLRARPEDILSLAQHFLNTCIKKNQDKKKTLAKEALRFLLTNPWHGNVRELENAVERAYVLSQGNIISDEHFILLQDPEPEFKSLAVDEIEKLISENHPQSEEIISPAAHSAAVSEQSVSDIIDDSAPIEEWPSLETLELNYIKRVIKKVDGVKDRASKILGVDRKTLYRKLDRIEKDLLQV